MSHESSSPAPRFRVELSTVAARRLFLPLALAVTAPLGALPHNTVVADSITRAPLAYASVFDRKGRFAGTTDRNGHIAYVSPADYPVTVRYMGYTQLTVPYPAADSLFMQENRWELPEVVVVESRQKKMLHILAYTREYSTLSTYTDTVSLFREKMVDFMLPDNCDTRRHKGWSRPRVVASRSYYHFTNAAGLDSVSDRCNHHFTWADWVGVLPTITLSDRIAGATAATDTVRGRYSPSQIWARNGDRLSIDIDVLADTTGRRWVPGISPFMMRDDVSFEQFRLRLNYSNVAGNSVSPADLNGYSFNIESRGRGHRMFKFNRSDEPFFVTTYTEVYIIDKEYIPESEAKKWETLQATETAIVRPPEAPALQAAEIGLMARVESINHSEVRTAISPDPWLAGIDLHARHNVGHEVLKRLKGMLGIDRINAHRKQNKRWNEFKKEQLKKF